MTTRRLAVELPDYQESPRECRDEQAARQAAVPPFPSQTNPPAPSRPKVTRPKRPKPTPAPEADQLLRLCETGRLYELEAWIASGKRLTVPADYRKTPLEVARRTGFHSMVELLPRHEPNQSTKDALLVRACHDRQQDIVELALRHGASANAVPLRDALLAWDRTIVARLLECGADPITDYPFARAFQARVRTALGCYLDYRPTRPDLADALQEQADMALRHACSQSEARWVGLLLRVGANPRTRGLAIDEIDDPAYTSDPDSRRTALAADRGQLPPGTRAAGGRHVRHGTRHGRRLRAPGIRGGRDTDADAQRDHARGRLARIDLTSNVRGRDLGSVARDIEAALAAIPFDPDQSSWRPASIEACRACRNGRRTVRNF